MLLSLAALLLDEPCRIHLLEMMTSFYLFFCASYDLAFGRNFFWIYLYAQAITFLLCGLGYVGTVLPD